MTLEQLTEKLEEFQLSEERTKSVRKRIKELRLKVGYTQSEMSEFLNFGNDNDKDSGRVIYSRFENGPTKLNTDFLFAVADLLKVKIDAFFSDEAMKEAYLEIVRRQMDEKD